MIWMVWPLSTIYILIWAFIFAGLRACWKFAWAQRRAQSVRVDLPRMTFILPGLAWAIVLVVVGYRVLGVDLIFPIELASSWGTYMYWSAIPGVVLYLASGLHNEVGSSVKSEWSYWSEKSFASLISALGLSVKLKLARLVLSQALLKSCARCLPWLFSELIVVEALFNVPGLGVKIWDAAKLRDTDQLVFAAAQLFVIYAVLSFVLRKSQNALGKRLATYA